MELINVDGIEYQVRQTDGPNKKWVQTDKGERIAVRSDGVWKWKRTAPAGR